MFNLSQQVVLVEVYNENLATHRYVVDMFQKTFKIIMDILLYIKVVWIQLHQKLTSGDFFKLS